jgi:hypothetical protein
MAPFAPYRACTANASELWPYRPRTEAVSTAGLFGELFLLNNTSDTKVQSPNQRFQLTVGYRRKSLPN